ncbi:hypothetical protein [Aneurinibacillus terranovensis]|uniref:hypothetical protein n=1 Tax=Aneurinibacillus terranovensis TaxID=278991 RepID=UPI000423E140|nr:hypothetical protein [Aneurinibacillus terranovensis]
MAEITLSTGKKVVMREKRGQHHFIERALLAICIKEGGQNIGGILSTVAIQTVVGLASVDGEAIVTPSDLAGVYGVMDHFTYEEWTELEKEALPKEAKEKLDEAAKNLQTPPGSATVSN